MGGALEATSRGRGIAAGTNPDSPVSNEPVPRSAHELRGPSFQKIPQDGGHNA